jgi:predicted ATPase
MLLEGIQLTSFQSFEKTGIIHFKPGINLLIGQNNVGKSALIRALPFPLRDEKHRSASKWRSFELVPSQLKLWVRFTQGELFEEGLRRGTVNLTAGTASTANFQEVVDHVFRAPELKMELIRNANSSSISNTPSHGLDQPTDGTGPAIVGVHFAAGELRSFSRVIASEDHLPIVADAIWQRSMFHFSAERMNVGEYQAVHASRLDPNAANLPAVLATLLGGKGSLFERLVTHLRDIFPSTVGALSIQPMPNGGAVNEIRVWPTELQIDPDLSFALKESGTGVSQVIAILAAIMTVENAVIIIDEINSFLHPAAVKTLLRILQTYYAQHQYIISTHSPEVISYANPSTVHIVRREGYDSTVTPIDIEDVNQLRIVADHLGISMSDVFAADRVIWVEGETEEVCFPYVYRELVMPLPAGTTITKVAATGDFGAKQRDRAMVYDIYKQLSSATQPLVKGVVFSFDSETLNQDQMDRMHRESAGALHFLPRRLLECYLVHPHAIATYVNERDLTAREEKRPLINDDDVSAQLIALAEDPRLRITSWSGSLTDKEWLAGVDAANLIARAITNLSDQRVSFNKKADSLELVKLIIKRDPESLRPLADYIDRLIAAVGAN